MSSTRQERVSSIYHAALSRAPADRAAFVTRECGGDTALLREVESLLSYASLSASFLEQPAARLADPEAVPRHTLTNTQIGPYTLVAPLGAGGMADIYRARDTKLGRDVAIKILPSHFTADAERRARFAREARLLATLNHPNIGAIYSLEEANGVTGLVLELVEGETLAHRLERGPLPIGDALTIARQIADALEAAHEKGIVHRDLKPANIVLQTTGDASSSTLWVKVLDFGLAKSLSRADGEASLTSDFAAADSVSGRILGTVPYMSPEQARGQAVDRRTDIWAFGCTLFEMLSGATPFRGATPSDVIAGILDVEPDWTRLPAATPPPVVRLLKRCLRKDARQRLRDIADASIELEESERAEGVVEVGSVAHGRRTRLLVASIAAVGLAAAAWIGITGLPRDRPERDPAIEFTIVAPNHRISSAAMPAPTFELSPDGHYIAVAVRGDARSTIWLWPVAHARPAWRELPGTDGVLGFFWSPDSQALAFFVGVELKTVRISGGAPRLIATADLGEVPSGAWGPDGTIVFGGTSQLFRIAATGGIRRPVTALLTGESAHRWPSFLPDGRHFVFLAQSERGNELRVGSVDSGPASKRLGESQSQARYANGHLLFTYAGRLMAQRFDSETRRLLGNPIPIAPQIATVPPWLHGQFSVSETGRLALSDTGRATFQLTWMDRSGRPAGTVGDAGYVNDMSLSGDNKSAAVSKFAEQAARTWDADIWAYDLERGGSVRLTTNPADEFSPAWSPNARWIAFISARGRGGLKLFRRPSTPGSDDELLLDRLGAGNVTAPDWSPDGRFIMYTATSKHVNGADLWTLPLHGDGYPTVFLQTKFSERASAFSPDGRWVAYESDESGRSEVYVRAFAGAKSHYPVSRGGGRAPRWNGKGTELFYLALDGSMMAVEVRTAKTFHAGTPQVLFKSGVTPTNTYRPFEVARDGSRFLLPIRTEAEAPTAIGVVLDWTARLNEPPAAPQPTPPPPQPRR